MFLGMHTTSVDSLFKGQSLDQILQLGKQLWTKGIVPVFDVPAALTAFKFEHPDATAGFFVSTTTDEVPVSADFVTTLNYFSPDDVRAFKAAHPSVALINAFGKQNGDVIKLTDETLAAGADAIQLKPLAEFMTGQDFNQPGPELLALRAKYPDLLINGAGAVFGEQKITNVLNAGIVPSVGLADAKSLPAEAEKDRVILAKWKASQEKDAAAAPGGIDIQNIDVSQKQGGAKVQFNDAVLREIFKDGFIGLTPVIINITPIQNPLMILGMRDEASGKLKS